MTGSRPMKRRHLLTALILLVGLGSALAIYLTADDPSQSGLVSEFENSKRYMHDLELYGGKANLLANELRNWFVGLWQGRSLAFTVACITIAVAAGFFFLAGGSDADTEGKNRSG